MKKVFSKLLVVCLMGLTLIGLISCVEEVNLATPENFKIEDGVVTFDEVASATKYRLEIKDVETSAIIKRFVTSGVDLNTLNIPEGNYMIKVQSTNNDASKVSEFSEELSYKQIDLYAVKELKEEALIDGNYIKWMGRTSYNESTKSNTMYYSASGFEFKVKKTDALLEVNAVITGTETANASKRPYIVLVLDHDFDNTITLSLTSATTNVNIVGESGFIINDTEEHTLSVYKRSESIDSHIALVSLNTTGKFISGVTYKERKIEVIAASSSTGYGNLGTSSGTKTSANSDALHGFAFLTSLALESEINIVSASGWGIYASKWTSPNTLNMRDKYKYVDVFSSELWDYSNYTPDVVVVNFGTNDLSYINMFTGKEKEDKTEAFINNYVGFLGDIHALYPNAQIIVIYGLMQESGIYAATEEIYSRASKDIPNLAILKCVGDAGGCSSHPSLNSHKTISEALSAKIKELMGW